jgi:predicted nucleotidyltransferase
MQIDTQKLRELIASQGYTNTKLAKDTGLSRQAIQGILNKEWANVRRGTLQQLIRALKLPDVNALVPDPLAGYKARVAEEHSHLDFRGLGLPATEPRLLEDLFVPIRVRRVLERNHDQGCGTAAVEKAAEMTEPSVPAEEAPGRQTLHESLVRYRRLLLRGEPGTGKTTSLRHLARSYATGSQVKDAYPERSLTPLFVRLAEFAQERERDGQLSLVRFVLARVEPDASHASAAILEQHLKEELRRGACLVLLDGLDEVGGQENLTATLRDFIARYPDNQFVLTSRLVGLDTEPWSRLDFTTCDITDWQEDDIRDFARRWYTSWRGEGGRRRCEENERQAEKLSDAILSHSPLRDIATNPLMLTILAALHHANAALPRRRVDLYAKVVEVLLETWEAGKRAARPGDPLHGIALEPREFGWLLSRLGLAMQRQDHLLNPRWWVTEFVQQFLRASLALEEEQAKDQADQVIRYLCERSGLLVERGADIFGFSHRTFQEYFAARGILEEAEEGNSGALDLLRPYLYHPRWEEVVRLVAAQLVPAQATALLRTVLDDPDPAGRFLRRGLRLALRCLADGAVIADRSLLGQLFSEGGAIGESKWLGITLEIIDALLDLKATRYADDASKMLAEIEAGGRRTLSTPQLFYLSEAIHGPLWDLSDEKKNDVPGVVARKQVKGYRLAIVSLAPRLRRQNPDKWYAAVFRLLRNRSAKVPAKLCFIDEVLRYEAHRNEQVREVLEEALARDRDSQVRAACAWALRLAAVQHLSTVEQLLRALAADESDDVREMCAVALKEVAPLREDVRNRLKALLNSSAADDIRSGAVRGLRRVALTDPQLFESMVARARSSEEALSVRVACLDVINESAGEDPTVNDCLLSCLDDAAAPGVQRYSAQCIAEAMADGRLPWSAATVAKIEALLMGVTKPCVHAWGALGQLVDAKEIRGGLRLERLLNVALAPFAHRMTMAFVFGSVARHEQNRDSDIDLLIIGDVRLKELVSELRTAEQALGRVINPVLYTPESFREKYHAGDPFLLEVVRNQKIFLKGNHDELTELVAERLSQ